MKKFNFVIFIFIVSMMLTGCLRRAVDMSLPYYDGTLSGKVEFPLGEDSSDYKDIIIISTDSNVNNVVKKIELPSSGEFSIDLSPGEYYLSAFKDIDGDGSYTFGKEPIGGRLAHSYDYFRTYHPVLEKAKTVNMNPVLLKPFKLIKPSYGMENCGLIPEFSWEEVSGVDLYRIRVLDRSGKTMWTFDTIGNSVTYGKKADSGEETLASPFTLESSKTYIWLVLGIKKDGDNKSVLAYSQKWNFRT